MPNRKQYNLDYRPHGYWGPQEVGTHIGARIKGELRRQVAIAEADAGYCDHVIAAESLSDDHRSAAGAIHPCFMGGEYLPDFLPDEVEIARVTMQSTTMDIISIRARRIKKKIAYRIVDEYETGYTLIQERSIKPLTLRRLIALMEKAVPGGLIGQVRELNYNGGADPEEIYDFATASSGFYPQLSSWYDESNEEWLDTQTGTTRQERLETEYWDRFFQGEAEITTDEEQWRQRNKEALDLEVESRLHAEYRHRYMNRRPSESEDEDRWCADNEDELKAALAFETTVETCVNSSKWPRPFGAMASWGAAIRRGKIRSYVEAYLRGNRTVPQGRHDVDGLSVVFSESTHGGGRDE